jgi:hypothetical protein
MIFNNIQMMIMVKSGLSQGGYFEGIFDSLFALAHRVLDDSKD